MSTGRKNLEYRIDKAENPRNWLQPADRVCVNDTKDDGEEQLWHIFTDGSKSEQGVGSGVAVFAGKFLTEQLKFKLDNRCSNNQAEQLAIVKALEVIESQQENHNENRVILSVAPGSSCSKIQNVCMIFDKNDSNKQVHNLQTSKQTI